MRDHNLGIWSSGRCPTRILKTSLLVLVLRPHLYEGIVAVSASLCRPSSRGSASVSFPLVSLANLTASYPPYRRETIPRTGTLKRAQLCISTTAKVDLSLGCSHNHGAPATPPDADIPVARFPSQPRRWRHLDSCVSVAFELRQPELQVTSTVVSRTGVRRVPACRSPGNKELVLIVTPHPSAASATAVAKVPCAGRGYRDRRSPLLRRRI